MIWQSPGFGLAGPVSAVTTISGRFQQTEDLKDGSLFLLSPLSLSVHQTGKKKFLKTFVQCPKGNDKHI